MPPLIVLRLHPVEPIDSAAFSAYLDGLSIEVFDLGMNSLLDGVSLGVANYVAPPNPAVFTPDPASDIVQHWAPVVVFPAVIDQFRAVATAVIDVPAGVGPEHESRDIRIEITRGAASTVVDRRVYFNVPVDPGPLPANRGDYRFINAVSVYVELGDPARDPDPNDAFVSVPEDGTPPRFDDLLGAVNIVLGNDPGTGNPPALADLTPQQARHVAYEIAWNPKFRPLPAPRDRTLEEIYTLPEIDDDEAMRGRFEGDLQAYYATGNAEAERLAGFVYALAAAVYCEARTTAAELVGFLLPVLTSAGSSGPRFKSVRVLLSGRGAGDLAAVPATLATPFTVPAAYFYALGASIPRQVDRERRYRLATLQDELNLRTSLESAVALSIILPGDIAGVNIPQAARRLRALGATGGVAPLFPINDPGDPNAVPGVQARAALRALLADPLPAPVGWLEYKGADIGEFWGGALTAEQLEGHLELVLRALTDGLDPLIEAIKNNVPANAADDIDDLPESDWNALFGDPVDTTLLPAFTGPGTPEERVLGFVRHVAKFFAVDTSVDRPADPTLGAPPQFRSLDSDPLTLFAIRFEVEHGGPLEFGTAWDEAAVVAAIEDVFPGPDETNERAWLYEMVSTIDELALLAEGVPAELAFSVMEALYTRGFTTREQVGALALADFRNALVGTVAFEHADTIYANGLGAVRPAPPGMGDVRPVNPDGCLVNCVPPEHQSPLGPFAYLRELLELNEDSTCEGTPEDSDSPTLGELLSERRGPLGDLLVTAANGGTRLPLVDLVAETLEAIAADLANPVGVVNQTNGVALAGHQLDEHDAETLFAAVPEHSTPATPVVQPIAYENVCVDFSAPELPYSQPLDINRTYLGHLRTSRYAAMRRFRADITEFVLDPAAEPAAFQRHLWRYPVRIETAREYLRITPEEYDLLFTQDLVDAPAEGRLMTRELYGFPADQIDGVDWTDIVVRLPEFLRRSGLSWCQFLELWRSEFVAFGRDADDAEFPDCEPCQLDDYRIELLDVSDLNRIAVFMRLWQRLDSLPSGGYTFAQLRDICEVLHLYVDDTINPDFIRQLVAFQLLRDDFCLPLTDGTPPEAGATGANRTQILALWQDGAAAGQWQWARDQLLEQVRLHASRRHGCEVPGPEFLKLLEENLDPLSLLAGFDPVTPEAQWQAKPTHTLRFAEVLAKIAASPFGVGEIIHVFSVDEHLAGDDPFPEQPDNEAREAPLDLPDDERPFALSDLRTKLLRARDEIREEDAAGWTWLRIETALRAEFGYLRAAGADPLRKLGEHYFPTVLQESGLPVVPADRQYRVPLAAPAPQMWNTPPQGPFRYDVATNELYCELPLSNEAVLTKLARTRPLDPAEQDALRELYFLPRADLVPFGLLFENFAEAEERLIEEPDENRRWAWFQHAFALFHTRCRIIAEHLAGHVAEWTGAEDADGADRAWRLLAHLYADENRATASWENDAGQPPPVVWPDRPTGGAFAAILGLTGTGLLGELTPAGAALAWRELRGPLNPFGVDEDARNAAIPTVLPAMDLALTPAQEQFVTVRNGFAMANPDGTPLGGAQGFGVLWSGMLLVDEPGRYDFHAGAPAPKGMPPDPDAAEEKQWRVSLRRGQGGWVVLAHDWPDEDVDDAGPVPLTLRRGAYELTVELVQPSPSFDDSEDIEPSAGGFEVKYAGPDTSGELITVPHDRLFQIKKDRPLTEGIAGLAGAAQRFLAGRYASSLRDIRRTYERAFKAALFAHRFSISPRPESDDGQSELGYMLAHPDRFAGSSTYPDQAGYAVHLAFFDLNLLPLRDNFWRPNAAQDRRVAPTARRKQALFDWWERIFDYTIVRRDAATAPERPIWLLFHEAAEQHPDPPVQLLRHMGVDLSHASLVLQYFAGLTLTSAELEDDRWTVRAWQSEMWIRALRKAFSVRDIRTARPDLWAADDPRVVAPAEAASGNENLTEFVRDGCIENGDPRRYEDIKILNDALRLRGHAALERHLCGMDRILIRPGVYATIPRQLSDLLLVDVEAGLCQRATRVEEAIRSVQAFVARARLGLEPSLTISPELALLWDRRFATFRTWEACKRRDLYRENWIEWDELRQAKRSEAFRFLESELRRSTLTMPVPGGVEFWPDRSPPEHCGLTLLQTREPAGIRRIDPIHHGFDLMGLPERHARPSWLAQLGLPVGTVDDGNGDDDVVVELIEGGGEVIEDDDGAGEEGDGELIEAAPREGDIADLPFWMQAAIRLGVRFIRVAAAAEPPGSTSLRPRKDESVSQSCCEECCEAHSPLVDEYYFWLLDTHSYKALTQAADDGVGRVDSAHAAFDPNEPIWTWHDPSLLPKLLHWDPDATVHLAWCRVHNGEFRQARRSATGVVVAAVGPELTFAGRTDDSLRFGVVGGQAPTGHDDPAPPGFRYDLVTDTAVSLPLVVAPPPPPMPPPFRHPGGLEAYPYFAYFAPGAPVSPASLFGTAVAVAAALRSHCRFEAALRWYGLAFAPLTSDASWLRCELEEEQPDGGYCHDSTVSTDEDARRRAILLHSLETLLDWGDAVSRRNTQEAFQQARLLYDVLATVLGAPPRTVIADDADDAVVVAQFVPHHAPLNPRLLGLYEQIADRLALIHACLNATRRRAEDAPAWGDNGARQGWQTSDDPCLDDDDWCLCPSPYRFTFQLPRALELAGELRNLEAALVAAYEKGDAEYLASLRATHERQLLDLTVEIRQDQWREADWQVQSLEKTKAITQTRQRFYTLLIENGRNNREDEYIDLTNAAIGNRLAGNISEGIAQAMGLIPDLFAGFPVTQTWIPLGTKISGVFMAVARIANVLAEVATTTGGLRLTEAGFERREEEWRHQVEVLGLELQQIERQTLAAERRRDIALRELNNHQRQVENSAEIHDFLRDKFTSHELYLFLQQETAAQHGQIYDLALHAARRVQRAFNLESGHLTRTFLTGEIWDNLHEGLGAGDRLGLALRRMDQAYACANEREYELSKHVSLCTHFPLAFLCLRTTGACEIELPEWMFDLDYPGQYMRRIKNVTLTVPCTAGPYTGVHCRLTLLSSTTRVTPHLSNPAVGCCGESCDCRSREDCCGYCEQPPNGYEVLPDDYRIIRSYAATEAIATSGSTEQTGLFELNFRDERYLPFEFAGAVSRWRVELPPETNYFDFDTLSDVVLHLNYTAREGGGVLRDAAAEHARGRLPGDGVQLFDVRRDLSDAWSQLQHQNAEGDSWGRRMDLLLKSAMFPFVPMRRVRWVSALHIIFEAPHADPSKKHVARFWSEPRAGRAACEGDDRDDSESERIDVACIASHDYPGLFWGVVDLEGAYLGPIHQDSATPLGTLEFPSDLGEICDLYLIAGYCADQWPNCGKPLDRPWCGETVGGRPEASVSR